METQRSQLATAPDRLSAKAYSSLPALPPEAVGLSSLLADLRALNPPEKCLRIGIEAVKTLLATTKDAKCLAVALAYPSLKSLSNSGQRLLSHEERRLLVAVRRMEKINLQNLNGFSSINQSAPPIENLRRMVLSVVQDLRVPLIKLAERHATLLEAHEHNRKNRKRIAREIFRIYAPIATRLGVWKLKHELEDLCFKVISPRNYDYIRRAMAVSPHQSKIYLDQFTLHIRGEMEKAGIPTQISTRAKSIFSTYRKIRRKNISIDELADTMGVRVIVDTVPHCYAVLGIIHSLFHHLRGEFDDYIGNPKPNGYRAIHTALLGTAGHKIEVQIRTHEMDEEAETGAASHGVYKGDLYNNPRNEKRLWSLKQVAEKDLDDIMDIIATDHIKHQIYVFTPAGEVVELPSGASVLDFAYHVHSEVGDRCTGGLVNGIYRPMQFNLRSGQQVRVLTSPTLQVNKKWLAKPTKAFTARAAGLIRRKIRVLENEDALEEGSRRAQRILNKHALRTTALKEIGNRLGSASVDELLVALARNEMMSERVAEIAGQIAKTAEAQEKEN